eukprot:166390-Chlamydomonas_euryale.AAC.1
MQGILSESPWGCTVLRRRRVQSRVQGLGPAVACRTEGGWQVALESSTLVVSSLGGCRYASFLTHTLLAHTFLTHTFPHTRTAHGR